MDYSFINIVITSDCNFSCTYCIQHKEKKKIKFNEAKQFYDFFYAKFANNVEIVFFGGEPLLEFRLIEKIVTYFKRKNTLKKKIQFTISTNASLIDNDILEFLDKNKFKVIFSFDGYAQNYSREANSFEPINNTLNEIKKYDQIKLEINSVFTPKTIKYFSNSIKLLINKKTSKIRYNLNITEKWNIKDLENFEKELNILSEYIFAFFQKNRVIPVLNFLRRPEETALFSCFAGKDRLIISPGGDIWGCSAFYDYLKNKKNDDIYKDYHLGNINAKKDEISVKLSKGNYSDLKIENFKTEKGYCFLCKEIETCSICPIIAAYSTNNIGEIPIWVCRIKKIEKRIKKKFNLQLDDISINNF